MIFNANSIKDVRSKGKKYTIRDETRPNLELRVYANGSRQFYYRSRTKLYRKDIKLGDTVHSALPLYDALFKMSHLPATMPAPGQPNAAYGLGMLFEDGVTLTTLKQRFLREYVSHNVGNETLTQYINFINELIVYLERHKLRLATTVCSPEEARKEIKAFLAQVRLVYPIKANRMASCFCKMFAWGEDNMLVTSNPATKLPRVKEKAIKRFMDLKQLQRFLAVLNSGNYDSTTVDALKLILLTGMRSGEVRRLTRDMVDLVARRIVLPAEICKNGRAHLIALSQEAAALLHKRCEWLKGEQRVFPKGNSAFHQACERASLKAGYRATPHVLRKSFATLAGSLGVSTEIISRMLNHTIGGVTTAHYAFYEYESEKRDACGKVGRKLADLISASVYRGQS